MLDEVFEVTIPPKDPHLLGEVVGADRAKEFADSALDGVARLDGRAVINVNSTATGGGVAEMLYVLLAYVRGLGIDARWLVVDGEPDFFELTKRIHNHLYGGTGDGGPLDTGEHDVYRRILHKNAEELARHVRPGDLVILHDPQTAGLAEAAKSLGAQVVWRCHVGIDEHNDNSLRGWDFLRPYLEPHVDHYVFTDAKFPPPWISAEQTSIIWPSIDPFAPKNHDMDDRTVEAILTHVGIISGRSGDTHFTRIDGTPGRVESYCDVMQTGPAPSPDVPMLVQVSRWDVMKDMTGVMESFATYVDGVRDAHLVLAGPVVSAVADDPEGGEVLYECWEAWRQLSHAVRAKVSLVCLPMHDLEENAAIVNALQRHASIVSQKSIAEGFGLTVAEAMLKGTPVIASAVGGIVDQVVDGETGRLIHDPLDLDAFGAAVVEILDDADLRKQLGEGARRRAIDTHLGDTHLERWLDVVNAVIAAPTAD